MTDNRRFTVHHKKYNNLKEINRNCYKKIMELTKFGLNCVNLGTFD